MMTVKEAFQKFRTKLELTQKEQDDASRRQKEIREHMDSGFKLADDFLTGSYKRWTKTKPLKDVDIFCVFHEDERDKYRNDKHPSIVLEAVRAHLAKKYGDEAVKKQRRSVVVEFTDSSDEERVMSFDVVPAFTKSCHYEIPDTQTVKGWTETDPRVHADKATAAHRAFSEEWKGMVRMIKAWNRHHTNPVKPSFLLEVMALQILRPPFGGDYPYEFMTFFATAADRIQEQWADPAGLGPPVSDSMTASERQSAQQALHRGHQEIREAINLGQKGRSSDELRAYRQIFGPYFSLS
jgi:bisphosphoglycerate-dependent phosphoglycerate mutase